MIDVSQIEAIFSTLTSDVKGVVSIDGDKQIFIKYLTNPPSGFFNAEVNSYKLLRNIIPNNVPDVLFESDNGIATEFISQNSDSSNNAIKLAHLLAAIHMTTLSSFGANWQGYIGTLKMDNTPKSDYGEFFFTNRIEPYLKTAYDDGLISSKLKGEIVKVVEDFTSTNKAVKEPCLVHGDLWRGNILFSDKPFLIDPACHGAHRELDLAMIQLFGIENQKQFFRRYNEIYPLEEGYQKRILANQLFYLLVHVILFGKTYISSIRNNVETYFNTL